MSPPSGTAADEDAAERAKRIALLEQAQKPEEDPEDGWALEEMRWRFAAFFQDGRGLQSQDQPVNGRGLERAWILEPLALARVRQTKKLHHEIYFPVDIVSAASPDALDAVATASRTNEAFALDVNSTYQASSTTDVAFRYGFHIEEPLRSFDAGPSFTFHLFEDNTTLTFSAVIIADGFDPLSVTGYDSGFTSRTTFSGNVSYGQILSPTTYFDASFGTTEQWGTLATTWNAVAVHREEGSKRKGIIGEQLPPSRNRDALFLRLSQHIPLTHTTVKASYRFYWDENKATAHTGEVELYQYLLPWLYVRVHGRLHHQDAPDFWVPFLQEPFRDSTTFRSSDSDLETLAAREAGLKIVLDRSKAPRAMRANDTFDLGYLRYQRDNGLHVDYVSMAYSRVF